jgi:hypothetical protein
MARQKSKLIRRRQRLDYTTHWLCGDRPLSMYGCLNLLPMLELSNPSSRYECQVSRPVMARERSILAGLIYSRALSRDLLQEFSWISLDAPGDLELVKLELHCATPLQI